MKLRVKNWKSWHVRFLTLGLFAVATSLFAAPPYKPLEYSHSQLKSQIEKSKTEREGHGPGGNTAIPSGGFNSPSAAPPLQAGSPTQATVNPIPAPTKPSVNDGIAWEFDYPVGNPDADGRRFGDGWQVTQDFRDRVNPVNNELIGQHLGEDWRLVRKDNTAAADEDRRNTGQPVYSVASGTIVNVNILDPGDLTKVRDSGGGMAGGIVMIRHKLPPQRAYEHLISVYMHLDPDPQKLPRVGEVVSRGQSIGVIAPREKNGNYPEGYPPHLHFELRAGKTVTCLEDDYPFATEERETGRNRLGYLRPEQLPVGWLNPTEATSPGNDYSKYPFSDCFYGDYFIGKYVDLKAESRDVPSTGNIATKQRPDLPRVSRVFFAGMRSWSLNVVGYFPPGLSVAVILPNKPKPVMGKTGRTWAAGCPSGFFPCTAIVGIDLDSFMRGESTTEAVAVLDAKSEVTSVAMDQLQGNEAKRSLDQALRNSEVRSDSEGFAEGIRSRGGTNIKTSVAVERVPNVSGAIVKVSISVSGNSQQGNEKYFTEAVLLNGKCFAQIPEAGCSGFFFSIGPRLFYRYYFHRGMSGGETFSIFEITAQGMTEIYMDRVFAC